MVFLISPPYSEPPMMASRWVKLMMMKVSVRVPSITGEAWKDGAQITVNSGTCRLRASVLRIFMNMLRANRLCQAFSVIILMGMR
jgi:hypothetical protein